MNKGENLNIRLHDFTASGITKTLERAFKTKSKTDCLESKIALSGSSSISIFNFSDGVNMIKLKIKTNQNLQIFFDYYEAPPLILMVIKRGKLVKQNPSQSTIYKSATQSIILDKRQSLDKWKFTKKFEGMLILIDRKKYNHKIACYFSYLPNYIAELFKNTNNKTCFTHQTNLIFPVTEAFESINNDNTSDIVRCNIIEGNTLEIMAFIIQRYKAIINRPHKQNYKLSNLDIQNIQKAREYINQNFTKNIDELTIDKLAQLAVMNTNKFKIAYNEIYSETVRQSIIRLKLSKAKKLLINNNKSISEIAIEVGYNNTSYFSKVFKKKLNIHPKDYFKEVSKKLSSINVNTLVGTQLNTAS